MIIWIIRAVFILICVGIIIAGISELGETSTIEQEGETSSIPGVIIAALALVLIALSVDLFIKRKSITALAGIFFGLLMGALVGAGFNFVVNLLYDVLASGGSQYLDTLMKVINMVVTTVCCYLSVVFVMQSKDDFRFIIPYVEFSKQSKGAIPLILDTSVIIDGRIADIAETRILTSPMIIPRFVLNELQTIADSPDRLRRNRGRRGLDILNKMQTSKNIDLTIEDVVLSARDRSESVDHKLVSVGKKLGGKVVTNDYNLNKVAGLRGVEVININDLANALKPIALPGESMRIKVVKNGDQVGQGIGYMEDGTMVVVENGQKYLQQQVDLVVTSVLQTSAGRMIFGKVEESFAPTRGENRPPHHRRY